MFTLLYRVTCIVMEREREALAFDGRRTAFQLFDPFLSLSLSYSCGLLCFDCSAPDLSPTPLPLFFSILLFWLEFPSLPNNTQSKRWRSSARAVQSVSGCQRDQPLRSRAPVLIVTHLFKLKWNQRPVRLSYSVRNDVIRLSGDFKVSAIKNIHGCVKIEKVFVGLFFFS